MLERMVESGIAFDQARAKNRCGNSEDDVVELLHLFEVWLRHGAALGVLPPGDGEDIVNAAIRRLGQRSIGIHN